LVNQKIIQFSHEERMISRPFIFFTNSTMNTFLTPRLLEAISLAVFVHSPMIRKGDGLPYITHPMAVFGLLTHWGADEDTCIAGLLHDVLEDVPENEKGKYHTEIGQKFGANVLEIVEGVTEQDKSLPWKERKKLYLEHLKVASKESLMVSCADCTHNLSTLADAYEKQGEEIWKRFNAIKQWKVWHIDNQVTLLKERLPEKYLDELLTHQRALNQLLSNPLLPEYQNGLSEVPSDKDGTVRFSMDPLYQELWDHCMLTEQEMEDGMLADTKEALQRKQQ